MEWSGPAIRAGLDNRHLIREGLRGLRFGIWDLDLGLDLGLTKISLFPKKGSNNSFDILVESIRCYECGWAKGDGGGDNCGAFDSSIETTCAGAKLK